LTKKDLEHFRKRLLEERKRVLEDLAWVESNYMRNSPKDSGGEVSSHATHLADMGTDSSEQEKAYLIGDASGEVLEDIDEALDRIGRGRYGICES
jgi:RNA polymerase-binding transcription factor DksA